MLTQMCLNPRQISLLKSRFFNVYTHTPRKGFEPLRGVKYFYAR